MPIRTVAEETVRVGEPIIVEGCSPSAAFAIIFEDNGTTGYLYGMDLEREGNRILDAMHIYIVAQVTDRQLPSIVQLAWSADGLKAILLINAHPHAVFDFEARRGYCRTGFPPASDWTNFDHTWDDGAIELFR